VFSFLLICTTLVEDCSAAQTSQQSLPTSTWAVCKAERQPPLFFYEWNIINTPTKQSVRSALESRKRAKMSMSFADNINSFNVSNHYTLAEDRSEILTWLSPLEPRIRHQDLRTRRADNVGEWLLETDEFKRWFDGAQQRGPDYASLFCCGGPGVGKTYLR